MAETINAVCPSCKKTFVVPAEYEYKKVKCKCGKVFSAREKPSHNKSVIVLGVVVSLTLILSVFLMWLFIFRANMRATVNGGAWLTRKAGNSEPIRGLNIEAIKSQGQNDQLLAILQASLEFSEIKLKLNMELKNDKEMIESTQKNIEDLQGKIRTISRDSSASVDMLEIRLLYKIYDLSAKLAKRLVELEYESGKVSRDKWIALNKAYMKIRITWEAICLEQAVGSTHTDVDGKYRIELPVGSYYLYAAFESEYSSVDWFIPLQVLSNEEIKVDFHNENADRIDNKDTSP